ncbi:hypothetical protein B0H19DRAFT_1057937 [Mycena capillaripes]|nr:hypothetical protein B0H19DRAFT_1057937 [Mycena capillaripes]
MDSENQPLLADVEVHNDHPNAGHSPSQQLCSRCSSHLDSKSDSADHKMILRHILFAVAILLSVTIFSLLVAQMAVNSPDVTVSILAVLLHMGRRRNFHRKLGRTVTQIRVLCALAISWILLLVGMIAMNSSPSICGRWWNADSCALYSSAHGLAWVLVVVLFAAAYATYRRAVAMHGTVMMPIPVTPVVSAWRLSSIADSPATVTEGSIKI